MLIVCNKTDALADELAGISPKNMVKKRLEVLPALLLGRVYAAPPPPWWLPVPAWRHAGMSCSHVLPLPRAL